MEEFMLVRKENHVKRVDEEHRNVDFNSTQLIKPAFEIDSLNEKLKDALVGMFSIVNKTTKGESPLYNGKDFDDYKGEVLDVIMDVQNQLASCKRTIAKLEAILTHNYSS
jgi:hypothetical protein